MSEVDDSRELHDGLEAESTVEVSVTIANWNRSELLRECLLSVFATVATAAYEVIMVDNASSDDSIAMTQKEYPHVRVIANRENLGFGRAHNQAIRAASGRYIMALNNDARLAPSTLQSLVSFMDRHPDAGIVTCPGRPSGEGHWTTGGGHSRFPSVAQAVALNLLELLCPSFLPGVARLLHRVSDRLAACVSPDTEQAVQWARGGLLMIRRSMVEEIGAFDERFFMYYEETDLCFRARRRGWAVWCTPVTSYVHHGRQSTTLRQRERLHRTSGYHYFRKNGGIVAAVIFVTQHYLLRECLLTLRLSLGTTFRRWVAKARRAATASIPQTPDSDEWTGSSRLKNNRLGP